MSPSVNRESSVVYLGGIREQGLNSENGNNKQEILQALGKRKN